MRLSKRECVLLTVLAVMLIWYVGAGKILEPAAGRRREAERQLEEMEYRRTCVEKYLSKARVGNGRASAADTAADKPEALVWTELDDVAVDRLLQDLAARAGVRIRKMEIGAAEPFSEEDGMFGAEENGPLREDAIRAEENGLLRVDAIRAEENGLLRVDAIRAEESPSGGIDPSPEDLVLQRIPVYLELSAQTPGMIARLAEQIDSSPDSMAVDYMEIKEPQPRATASEAGSEVRCSMDVSFYWIKRQQAGEDF